MSVRLVRDHIGDLPWKFEDAKQGLRQVASREEHLGLIRRKLLEEVGEFLEATTAWEQFEEAADVLQVILDVIKLQSDIENETTMVADINGIRLEKLAARGGFSLGTVWET